MNGTVTISIEDYESYKNLKDSLYTVLNNDFVYARQPNQYYENFYIKKITEDEKLSIIRQLSDELVRLKTNNRLLENAIDKKDCKILLLEEKLNNKVITTIVDKKETFRDKINKFLNQ